VVIRNAFGTGWTATVDGQDERIVATDYLLQGVPVKAGIHDVELVYRDPKIGQGLVASGIVWGLWAVGLATAVALAWRRRRDRGSPMTSDVADVDLLPSARPVTTSPGAGAPAP